MAISYTQTDDNTTHCNFMTAPSPGFTECIEGGTAGSTEQIVTVAGQSNQDSIWQEIDITSETDSGGSWTVRLNVTTANSRFEWSGSDLLRLNGSCVEQEQDFDGALGIGLDSTGVKTHTHTGVSAFSLSNGDRVGFSVFITNNGHSDSSFGFTPDQDIDTPLTAGGGNNQSLSAESAGDAALTFTRPFSNIAMPANAAGSAVLTVGRPFSQISLDAETSGQAVLDRLLSLFIALSATVAGQAQAIRSVSVSIALAAVTAGQATLVTALTIARQLNAVVSGSAAIARKLTATRVLAAVGAGQAAIARKLSLFRTLAANVSGSATITALSLASLSNVALSATVSGAATLARKLTLLRALSAAVAGSAAMTAGRKFTQFVLGAVSSGSAALTFSATTATQIALSAVAAVSTTVSSVYQQFFAPFTGHGGLGMVDGLSTRWKRRRSTWLRRR